MLKIFGLIVNFFLILIIFIRTPEESAGLSGFTAKTNFLGSSSSSRRFLDSFTAIGVFIYLAIAIQLNLGNY